MVDDLAAKYANGYLKVIRRLGYGMDAHTHGAFSGENIDLLKQLLRETGDIADEDIDGIASLLKHKEDGAHSRAKQRMDMSENYGMWLKTTDGTGEEFVRVSDMLNNDIDNLFGLYTRQVTGAAALARIVVPNPKAPGEVLLNGITSRGEFDTLLEQVRAVAAEVGQSKTSLDTDIENLRFLYQAVAGIPHELAGKPAGQILRMLGDYNFLRVMNQVGFAQVAEIGAVTGQLGLKAAMNSMPSLKALWRNAKTGQL